LIFTTHSANLNPSIHTPSSLPQQAATGTTTANTAASTGQAAAQTTQVRTGFGVQPVGRR